MKEIYHIYFDCSGNILIGEKTNVTDTIITLKNSKFTNSNGVEQTLEECHVNKNKIAFYYIERKCEDE